VTGGLGFIGSNLALWLAGAGATVTVVDSLVPTHGGALRNIEMAATPIRVVVADIADHDATAPELEHAEYVFNLAGQVSHVDAMLDPVFDLDVNVRSHLTLLEALRQRNPHSVVVHTSTRQVYGRPRYLPVDEAHPANPVDLNGMSKLAGEQAHLIYAHVHSMAITSLRLTNIYGPRQRLSGDRQGFVPIFVRKALAGEMITVYGDGMQERDCLHVSDVVAGLVRAALTPEAAGQVINLSNTESLTLRAIADTVVAVAGSGKVTMIDWPDERSRIDIGGYRGDVTKAQKLLGWMPTINFSDGIRDAVAYARNLRNPDIEI
jgi:nucleoside-diphosphate-sugar epimerase